MMNTIADTIVDTLRPFMRRLAPGQLASWITVLIIFAFGTHLFSCSASAEQPTVFRDSRGSTIGTATKDNNGQTTFRNTTGQITGTANTNSNGTTTFRDRSGQTTGTAQRPSR